MWNHRKLAEESEVLTLPGPWPTCSPGPYGGFAGRVFTLPVLAWDEDEDDAADEDEDDDEFLADDEDESDDFDDEEEDEEEEDEDEGI